MKNNKSLPDAIILTGGTGGLGAARSLARRGITVTAVVLGKYDMVLYSGLVKKVFKVEFDGEENTMELNILKTLQSLPGEGQALLTTCDRLVTFMSHYEDELKKKFRFKLPPSEILNALNNKSLETKIIPSLGFAIPLTIQDLPMNPDILEEKLGLPIIFKPHGYFNYKIFPCKNVVVHSRKDLHEFYDKWKNAMPFLLAQEVIKGSDSESWVCSCTFDEDHKILDCGVKQKHRSLPPHFGGSTFAISKNNQEIVEMAAELGKRLKYVGHAGIEFRRDLRDNIYKYIELNPRMPANVGFDEACGLPTVFNSYLVALYGKFNHEKVTQREGIVYIDLYNDLWSQRDDGIPLLKAIANYKDILFKSRNGQFFAWDDPIPGLFMSWKFILRTYKLIIKKIFRA